jgi:P-type Ca2+ transporter type 2C
MAAPRWHTLTADESAALLGVGPEQGLTGAEADERRAQCGPNQLAEPQPPGLLARLFDQLQDFLVIILIAAAGLSLILGEYVDATAILAIVIRNAILGVVQERKAEVALADLKQLTAPRCRVLRDGRPQEIDSRDLVPGDLVLLEAGDPVPADGRLVQSVMLQVDESALTGEALPVEKTVGGALPAETPLAERSNLVYMGTAATYGRGRYLVCATGMETEVGHIAERLQATETGETPLQVQLSRFGRQLGMGMLAVCALLGLLGWWRGAGWAEVVMVAVSLAVATIPEGLPAVVTIVLALGTQRMARRRAVIRKLAAVETLGCTTVICSDKTGTLTQNRMAVTQLWTPSGEFDPAPEAERRLLQAGALCNDATAELGDPTETALVVAAAKFGLDKQSLDARFPRVAEVPFSSERKRMTTIHPAEGGGYLAVMKGAPQVVLSRCRRAPAAGDVEAALHAMGRQGLRVLAVAVRQEPELPGQVELLEDGLDFVGLLGLSDPPRPEAGMAVQTAARAGIRSVMITGDYLETALTIAAQVGIEADRQRALTGPDLEELDDAGLDAAVERVSVFARVSPEHKLRIVAALRRRGQIVAMTGDGVNDAPALKQADIGVAMGLSGTGVARGAADMVLMDDNFATIVAAVEEGRAIYGNIQKFAFFLLSSNLGELLVMTLAITAGLPMPLTPVHLLWINLVTDSLPAVALGVEPPEAGGMGRPPRAPGSALLGGRLLALMSIQAVLLAAAVLTANAIGGQTYAFATLSLAELWWAHGCRDAARSPWGAGLFANRSMWVATLVGLLLVVAVIQLPFLQVIFAVRPLEALEWLQVLGLSLAPALLMEPVKRLI